MPIYDYKCIKCSTVTEKIKPSTVTEIECPKCPCVPAMRQLSIPAVVRIAGVGVKNPRGSKKDRISEPVWRDEVTGNVTSMY